MVQAMLRSPLAGSARRLGAAAFVAALALVLFTSAARAAAPAITGVSPNSGPIIGGTSVVITGTDFTGTTSVTFGGAAATFVVGGPTSITAVTPAHAAGVVDVRVTTPEGTSPGVVAAQFTYANAITVSSVSPSSGPAAGGTTVTVTGTGFSGASSVTFGGTPATFVVATDTQLTAVSPPRSAGPADVRVSGPGGTSPVTAGDVFTYVGAAAPVVTGVSPSTGPIAGGTVVTISGTGFTGATGVTLGGIAATALNVASDTTLLATTPAHAAGTVDVLVTGPSGTSAVNSSAKFTYTGGLPVITSISPPGGPVTGGTVVTLTGTGFTGATQVRFGGTDAPSFTVVSDTTITVTSPPRAAGLANIQVTTPAGTSQASAFDVFTYGAIPTVTNVSPATGQAGTVVTITGTGFTGATSVTFGGVAGTSLNVASSGTSLTISAPAHAPGGVDVIVVAPSGSSAVTASSRFTYTGATQAYTLSFRWSLISWNGPDGMTVAAALSGQETPDDPATNNITSQVTAMFRWNGPAQRWEAHFPNAANIPGANDFTTLSKGTSYWIAISGPGSVSWTIQQG